MKTHAEITARLALYRNHTVQIPAANGKMITDKLVAHWDELKAALINHKGLAITMALTHTFTRQEMPHDPKGEAFIKYFDHNFYRLKQEDFELRFGYTSSYGFDSSAPLAVGFEFDYYHSGEHQFGIYAPFSGSDNLIHQLELRSMDHSEAELVAVGNALVKLLQ